MLKRSLTTEWQKTATCLGSNLVACIWVRAPCPVPSLDAYYQKNPTETKNENFKNWCGCRDEKKHRNKRPLRMQEDLKFSTHSYFPPANTCGFPIQRTCCYVCWWNVGMSRELQIFLHPEWSLVSVLHSSIPTLTCIFKNFVFLYNYEGMMQVQ